MRFAGKGPSRSSSALYVLLFNFIFAERYSHTDLYAFTDNQFLVVEEIGV
jgi:hypothetical protein